MYLLSMAMATKSRSAPRPMNIRRPPAAPSVKMPSASEPAPRAATSTEMAVVNLVNRVGGSAEPSCRAATGGTRVARMAGTRAENRVTPTPTSTAMTIVRGSSAMPAVGMSTPRSVEQQR